MIDLFQDRRIFINQKRKHLHKNGLPQIIKYPLALVKKNQQLNQDYLTTQFNNANVNLVTNNNNQANFNTNNLANNNNQNNQNNLNNQNNQNNQNNLNNVNNLNTLQSHIQYQPLSNILISKRICPASTSQSLSSSAVTTINKKKKIQTNQINNLNREKHIERQMKKQLNLIGNIHSNNFNNLIQFSANCKKQSVKRIMVNNRNHSHHHNNNHFLNNHNNNNNYQNNNKYFQNNQLYNMRNHSNPEQLQFNLTKQQPILLAKDYNYQKNQPNLLASKNQQELCIQPLIQHQNMINSNIIVTNGNYSQFQQIAMSNNSNLNTDGKKRNSTSLSYRIRMKEKERLFMDNNQNNMIPNSNNDNSSPSSQQNTKIKPKINKIDDAMLTFLVPKANNNQALVKQILLSRKIWRQIKPGEQIPSFKWIFSKQRYNYKKMQTNSYIQKRMVNHFQFNEQISTKDNLIRNLQIYCETKKMEMFSITPITFVIDFDDQWCEYHIKQFLAFFSKHDPRKGKKQSGGNTSGSNISSSNNCNMSFNFLGKFNPYMAWQNSDIKKKVNILSKPLNNSCYYSENSYLWLLKPTGLNRGRGIQIFDSLESLEKILMNFLQQMNRKKYVQLKEKQAEKKKEKKQREKLKEKEKEKVKEKQKEMQKHKDKMYQLTKSTLSKLKNLDQPQSPTTIESNKKQFQPIINQKVQPSTTSHADAVVIRQNFKLNTCSFVIQKYVERPFLINGRKFDIRVWALLTHKMELFFFKQGYIRTSTQVYNTQDMNYYIHLTNNAIQKNSQNYGQFQNGNQLSFKQLKDYMPQQKVSEVWGKIKEITHMAFSSVKKKINYYQRPNCFQLFGLDYFIDSDSKVWLIQVNQNPCIQCSSDLLGELIPRMLNDAFKLTVDLIMDKKRTEEKVYKVEGYLDGQNMWQSLGQLIANAQYSPKKKSNQV